ncbi:Haloacid dehalogenase-like hydrolase-domain-containing protein [Massariosphaeria phaeospora]|uniref:Haloacid dehalogenase-like hydrolase-domain-containing protein n=1 Tax=Massariosphaeria phaeospora TaxID=100035 RepID=A0A7C8I3S2_9PLEO|nr:Haloacid dehalogenase-like hydrolase-domain-containing protein [Massariosphaeria phaeospora]
MSPPTPIKAVIFDIGDVLFNWSPYTKTPISARTFHQILASPTWHAFECGHLTQDACYAQIGLDFSLAAEEVAEACAQARGSLQRDETLVAFIKELKGVEGVHVYAMSNMAKEDFDALAQMMDWALFERVFTSAAAGMRKPDMRFYEYVLQEMGCRGEDVLFVDDKVENVRAAEELGMRAFVWNTDETVQCLRELVDGPVARGWAYLRRNRGKLMSFTDSGITVPEHFAQLLILEATEDRDLVNIPPNSKGTWNFFAGEPTLIPGGYFPDDLDATAIALTVLSETPPSLVSATLDKMAQYANADGTFLTYFDRAKPRLDPVVTANVLAAFYRSGRGAQHPRSLKHIRAVVQQCAYLSGTRYYGSADVCLHFFTRLLQAAPNDHHL